MRKCVQCGRVTDSRYCVFCKDDRREKRAAWGKQQNDQAIEQHRQKNTPVAALAQESQPPERPKLWTAQDLADYLRIPVSWVKTKARQNIIPHIKVGRYYSFDPQSQEFREWLDSLKVARPPKK